MRVALWSPLPPVPSGIADYVAETLPRLSSGADLACVVEDPASVDPALRARVRVVSPREAFAADVDVYHVGNSPAHTYLYRAALDRPGLVVLHEWSLHHLVLREALERGEPTTYQREMRRAYGERGSFVARQVLRGLGGDLLPALFPLNERVLETSLGTVALTRSLHARATARLPGRPALHLPLHYALPFDPPPSRPAARRALGLPDDALLVTAPGLATPSKRLDLAVRVVARLRRLHPSLHLVIAGQVDPALPLAAWAAEAGLGDGLIVTGRLGLADFARHLVAADVVLCLRFPSHGEMSAALVRALGIGRPALVTAGTPASEEFPEGVVVPVTPGPGEEAEMEALLGYLLETPGLRERIGALAREHVLRHHDLGAGLDRLLVFLGEVLEAKPRLLSILAADRGEEGTLLGYLLEEVRWSARDLGLPGLPLPLRELLTGLAPR